MRLVQLQSQDGARRVALVDEPALVLLETYQSVYSLAADAIRRESTPASLAADRASSERLDYDSVYHGKSEWLILPAFDHPDDPQHCLVTGTGLTHKASAANREKMHQAESSGELTDSMRMYLWGVEGGRPRQGEIGQQPEWFYKGSGHILRAHGQPLEQPSFAEDGGEEPEVAAAYLIGDDRRPWRIGFAPGNEFSDHVMEKRNYLNLAHSKLRPCAIGPELSLSESFADLEGRVSIMRQQEELWTQAIESGEAHMAHSLANLEHHHFKYAGHRQPGQAHVHFFGAAAFSFGALVQLQDGDLMRVEWHGMGRPLVNRLAIDKRPESPVAVAAFSRD